VVTALENSFREQTGAAIEGSFGAVGAMKEKLEAGAPCDAIILTAAMIEELAKSGHLLLEAGVPLGRVRTGMAVRAGDPVPAIHDPDALRAALLAARGIYVPDITRSTAGRHFVDVLKRLGIDEAVASRVHAFPNGAMAMRELAAARGPNLVGCTQITEIRYTPGVSLVGALPAELESATVYTAAVASGARDVELARAFVALVGGPASRTLREQCGFEL
jgi:molybdate transport system substrate-binding protein